MGLLDDEAWVEMHRLYSEEGRSFKLLALQFGVSPPTISKRAKSEGWVKGVAQKSARKVRRTSARVPTLKSRRAIIARLFRAISRKLEHMEVRMMSGERRSVEEEERESRALGAMIRNFEKVTEVVAELDRSVGGRPKNAAAASSDAERMRREIAERVSRLATERAARGGTGEPR